MEYDFCVIINSYNRPEMLNNLIEDINNNQKDYKIIIGIFDDCSNQKTKFNQSNIKNEFMNLLLPQKKYV